MNIKKMNNYKKALVVTTVASTIDQFCMNDISILQKEYKVHVAANFELGNNTSVERVQQFKSELNNNNIVVHEVNFNRRPHSKDNFYAYKEMKRIIENNCFDIIHCHTPVAAMLVRLAGRSSHTDGTKIIYTAHGFHFFKGAPIINWLLYYPVERWFAKYTDILITINKEDYGRAERAFKAGRVKYIPGVGIDINKFNEVIIDKPEKRRELAILDDSFVVLSVGELNKNKNHETIIKALAKLNNREIHYLICGQGGLEDYLRDLAKELGLEKQVHLLGFRKDVAEIYKISDLFVFPSFREGLSVALMEAMATGLPVVCSDIRGNNDLIQDGNGGYLVKPYDILGFFKYIEKLYEDDKLRTQFGDKNIELVQKYSIENVLEQMKDIYTEIN